MLLFRVLFTILLSALAAFCPWVRETISAHPVGAPIGLIIAFFVASFIPTAIAGSASRGVALRKVIGAVPGKPMPDPSADIPHSQRWYIESKSPEKGLPHSCSFVEFDERGDYLDFHQHLHAYEKVQTLAKAEKHLIVVVFVHGWRNNCQSGNVVSFNEFLHQLATYSDVNGVDHRVHGIYLSWRGACLKHDLDRDNTFAEVTKRFGGEIVDTKYAARLPKFNFIIESLSYFDRKGVPEHLSSGTSLSRTLFTCAHVAKRFLPNTHVFLIGHSFGGLMLERTFQNATIAELVDGWTWGDPDRIKDAKANPLPFDTVLLINSAAPSIYARQFQSFMAAHRQAMARDHVTGANAPVFFSLTSSGDDATGGLHPKANTFCFLLPTLRRDYKGDDFVLAPGNGSENLQIQQSFYYRHTPGHNPLLVNRFIEPSADPLPNQRDASTKHLRANLEDSGATLQFTTTPKGGGKAQQWSLNFPPKTDEFEAFSIYKARGQTFRPIVWEKDTSGHYRHKDTAYWIIRCPAEIIKDHNDIWNQQAMDMYAALYAISLHLKSQSPA